MATNPITVEGEIKPDFDGVLGEWIRVQARLLAVRIIGEVWARSPVSDKAKLWMMDELTSQIESRMHSLTWGMAGRLPECFLPDGDEEKGA